MAEDSSSVTTARISSMLFKAIHRVEDPVAAKEFFLGAAS
jgi:hypothetical protein